METVFFLWGELVSAFTQILHQTDRHTQVNLFLLGTFMIKSPEVQFRNDD